MSRAFDPPALDSHLDGLARRPIEPTEKGFTALGPITPRELVQRRQRLHEVGFTFPLMAAREGALTGNAITMAAWCGENGVEIAPHAKTSMSPELTARQLRSGAWGVTAATIQQVRTFVDAGVRRILLANQLVDPAGIGWLVGALEADPGLVVIAYIDTLDGVALLDRELTKAGLSRPLPVLVELGLPGGRSGARGREAAVAVATAAADTTTLDVVGAAGFEGVLGHDRTPATTRAVAAFCRDIRALAVVLSDRDLLRGGVEHAEASPVPIVSAGGSSFFDVVAWELRGSAGAPSVRPIIRSGGYLTHDDGLLARSTPLPTGGTPYAFYAALEVWAHVTSRPEPDLVLACVGRRDVAFDAHLPLVRGARSADGEPRKVTGAEIVKLNDQHAFCSVPEDCELQPGDLLCLGISHPCTAFDKWRVIPVLDDEDHIVEVAHTFF